MTYCAKLIGTEIQMVIAADTMRDGWVPIAAPVNWHSSPGPQYRPHLINGSVEWRATHTPDELRAAKWVEVRAKRDALLRESDWRPLLAVDRGGQANADWAKSPWREYRQALREITNQVDPFSIVWPLPPAK